MNQLLDKTTITTVLKIAGKIIKTIVREISPSKKEKANDKDNT